MTLVELQNILGERIKIANDPNIDENCKKEEAETSKTIASLAKQMINNADVVLRAEKFIREVGDTESSVISKFLG